MHDAGAMADQGRPERCFLGEMVHNAVGVAESGAGDKPFHQLAQRVIVALGT